MQENISLWLKFHCEFCDLYSKIVENPDYIFKLLWSAYLNIKTLKVLGGLDPVMIW